MISVRFEPAGVAVLVAPGTSLADAIRRAGLVYGRACDDSGICGRCRVRIEPSGALAPPDALEARTAAMQGLLADERLACSARVIADVVVHSSLWSQPIRGS